MLGFCLDGTKREDVEPVARYWRAPGSITPHTRFNCEAYYILTREEVRHTRSSRYYRPQFYFRTTDVDFIVDLR